MDIKRSSVLEMLPLEMRKENEEEILIGRTDVGDFIILPNIGVDIIQLLDSGLSVIEVEKIMEEKLGEPVDVVDFIKDLINDYHFVYKIDNVVVEEVRKKNDHFSWIDNKVGQFLFNKWAFLIYFLSFISGLIITFLNPIYFPKYLDIFATEFVGISMILMMGISWFFLFVHEMAHLLAAKSFGVGSRISLSHRLVFMVAQTDISNIVLLPHKKRYKAYLAGIAWDAFFFGIGVWILFINSYGFFNLSSPVTDIIKMINIIFLTSIAFQFMFFMKTDLYYVFTNFFKCNNLIHNTNLFFRRCILKRPNLLEEWDHISGNEKKIISRGYAWFYILGVLWTLLFFIFYPLRQIIEFVGKVYIEITSYPTFSPHFFDGILSVILVFVPFGVVIWSWIRTGINNQRRLKNNITLQ